MPAGAAYLCLARNNAGDFCSTLRARPLLSVGPIFQYDLLGILDFAFRFALDAIGTIHKKLLATI